MAHVQTRVCGLQCYTKGRSSSAVTKDLRPTAMATEI